MNSWFHKPLAFSHLFICFNLSVVSTFKNNPLPLCVPFPFLSGHCPSYPSDLPLTPTSPFPLMSSSMDIIQPSASVSTLSSQHCPLTIIAYHRLLYGGIPLLHLLSCRCSGDPVLQGEGRVHNFTSFNRIKSTRLIPFPVEISLP